MDVTRRELVPFALSLTAACASPAPPALAQQQPRSPARPPAPPRLERAGDIAGLQVDGSHGRAGTMLLAQAFAPGMLPRGAALAARAVPGDRRLAASFTTMLRHADGSVRLAMVTLDLPPIAAGERLSVILSRAA